MRFWFSCEMNLKLKKIYWLFRVELTSYNLNSSSRNLQIIVNLSWHKVFICQYLKPTPHKICENLFLYAKRQFHVIKGYYAGRLIFVIYRLFFTCSFSYGIKFGVWKISLKYVQLDCSPPFY